MIIGVYRKESPLTTLPSRRIHALVDEAESQGVELFFFAANDIDLEQERIEGASLAAGAGMVKRYFPYPDVVLNEWPTMISERPNAENELRNRVPFTTHLIHNKNDIYMKLAPSYSQLLLPTKVVSSCEQLLAFLEQYDNVILKPENGRKGNHIFRVRVVKGEYFFHKGTNEERVTLYELQERLTAVLAARTYIMQQYWPVLNAENEPTDYRVHVQRDHKGQWQLTKVYPRVGQKDSIVSNISKGGRSQDIDAFLHEQYKDQAIEMKQRLVDTAFQLAETIDSFYSFLIDELGIDLLMNDQGEIRFLEANAGPETLYHEEERAIRAIGFARYIANVHQGRLQSGLPVIGMLTPRDSREELLREACAYVARGHDADFYYFFPDCLFFNFSIVKGYRLQKGKWESRYFNYPDVIYDRLKEKGNPRPRYAAAYSKLQSIPSTEDRTGGSFSKLRLYELLQADPVLANHLIPFQQLTDLERAMDFIHLHGLVVIKPSNGSFGDQIILVQAMEDHYKIKDHTHSHRLNRTEMKQLSASLVQKGGLLLQKFVNSATKEGLPFHIRIHMVRNQDKAWEIIEYFPYISIDPNKKVVNHSTSFRVFTKWSWFLDHQYPGRQNEMIEQIRMFAMKLAASIDRDLTERISEMGIDIGIDDHSRIWLYEANMNKVGSNFRELLVAKRIIPLALELRRLP